jgi:hypothetical protein
VSDAGSKKIRRGENKLSKNVIAKTARIRAVSDAGLEKFEQHKNTLIANLRDAHKQNPKSKPFGQRASWDRLTKIAGEYHWAEGVKQETMDNAVRKARLHVLVNAIEKTRTLLDRAMQDDVGDELSAAWREEAKEPLERTAEETFKKAVTGVTDLKTAALRASRKADGERVGAGRPKGTSILPQEYILALRDVYRESTGTKPEMGPGAFARLVRGFLDAIGHENRILERQLLEMIEDAFYPVRKRSGP